MKLLSINIGKAKPFANQTGQSAIDKRPVAGAVQIGALGLAGDEICDHHYHGGPDQAVYLYGTADYEFFAREHDIAWRVGLFGENLTIEGLDSTGINIGDRFEIGPVRLEATSPRIPCGTFATHIDDKFWLKKFYAAGRFGVYARVLQEGEIEAGQEVDFTPFTGPKIAITELTSDVQSPSTERMRQLLEVPIPLGYRQNYEKVLAVTS